MLKIIGGRLGGRRLQSPRGVQTRPSSARLREALFAILQAKGLVEEARVLDVCAGSGALGLEALSRGASFCTFVEQDKNALLALRANVRQLGQEEQALVLARDFRQLASGVFDLILADPPYEQGLSQELLAWVLQAGVLAPGAVLVLEHFFQEEVPVPEGLTLADQRRYGQSKLSFFEKQNF